MLQSIRDRLVGWVAWAFVIAIGLSFSIVGVVTDFGSSVDSPVVVEVNDQVVEQDDYLEQFRQRRQNLQQQLGVNYSAEKYDPIIQQQVLDTLIEVKLLEDIAVKNHMQVGNDEIAMVIQSDPSFHKDGKFDINLFKARVGQYGFTPSGYEETLRDDRELTTVPRVVRNSGFTTPSEIELYQQLNKQERIIDYLVVDRKNLPQIAALDDQAAQDYYEAHKEEFMQPQQVRFEYIHLNATDLASQVEVTEEAVKEFYEANADRYMVDEQRKASHILLNLPEGKTLQDVPEVAARLKEIQDKLAAGEDFSGLAKQYSDDPGSAQAGGELGQVLRGVMVPPFEDALFGMTVVGAVSEPVQTSFGIHLIRLDGITPEKIKTYDEVKDELRGSYAQEKAVDIYYDIADRLGEVAYENPDSLTPVAETTGLELKTSGWVSRKDTTEGVLGNADVLATAFNERLMRESVNSDPITIGPNNVLILRVIEVRPASQIAFDDAREAVKLAAEKHAQKVQLQQFSEDILSRLRQGEDMSSVAAAGNLAIKSDVTVKREGAGIPRSLVNHVFQMPGVMTSDAIYDMVSLNDDSYAVLAIKQIKDANVDTIDPRLQANLLNRTVSRESAAFLNDLKQSATITINKENLEQ